MDTMAAFKKARAASQGGGSRSINGNIVLQPTEFKDNTVVGKVLTGKGAGSEIEVEYGGKLGKKEYTNAKGRKATTSSFVDIEAGGTLRVERVRPGDDGIYKSRWMRTLNGQPEEGDSLLADAVCKATRYTRQNGQPGMVINRLLTDEETLTGSVDELKSVMASTMEAHGTAAFFGVVDGAPTDMILRKKDDVTAEETVNSFFENLPDEVLAKVEEAAKDTGISVLPVTPHWVVGTTLEAIETHMAEGKPQAISTVNPTTWQVPTMGMRLNRATNLQGDDALPEGTADKLAKAFKDFADKDEAEAFAKSGWAGVKDSTLTDFFAKHGVTVAPREEMGWSTQTLVQGTREPDNENDPEFKFVKKAFQTRPATPFPAVEALSSALNDYYTEMGEAAKAVVADLRNEADAAKGASKDAAAAAPAEDELPDDASDDLDALLGEVENEGLELEN